MDFVIDYYLISQTFRMQLFAVFTIYITIILTNVITNSYIIYNIQYLLIYMYLITTSTCHLCELHNLLDNSFICLQFIYLLSSCILLQIIINAHYVIILLYISNYPDYNKIHLNHLILTQWIDTTHVIILIPLHSYYCTIAAIYMYYNPKRVLCINIVKLLQDIKHSYKAKGSKDIIFCYLHTYYLSTCIQIHKYFQRSILCKLVIDRLSMYLLLVIITKSPHMHWNNFKLVPSPRILLTKIVMKRNGLNLFLDSNDQLHITIDRLCSYACSSNQHTNNYDIHKLYIFTYLIKMIKLYSTYANTIYISLMHYLCLTDSRT